MHNALVFSPSPAATVGAERNYVGAPLRPLPVRLAPAHLRTALYYRFYRRQRARWKNLYHHATLSFAASLQMKLCPTDEAHSEIAFTGFYELELSQRLAQLRCEEGLMIDVGANYGYFSLLWTKGSTRNRVLAFEASPSNQLALRENVISNGLASQIEIRDVAVGREAGFLPFSLGNSGQTGWGGFSSHRSEATVDVPVVTLDSVVPQDARINVLKIDVEGADTWVLYGARRLLETKRVAHIFFEQNSERMTALGILETEASDFLDACGYTVCPMGACIGGINQFHATVLDG